MPSKVCKCGWKVPVKVVINTNLLDQDAQLEYECPECGQMHYIEFSDPKPEPEPTN